MHMKGDMHSFHMKYGSLLSTNRLQSYRSYKALNVFSLVVWLSGFLFFYNLDNPSLIPREPENPSKGFGGALQLCTS